MVPLTAVKGILTIKDGMKDYLNCGPAMANMNFLDFFLNTYEGDLLVDSPDKRGRKPNK